MSSLTLLQDKLKLWIAHNLVLMVKGSYWVFILRNYVWAIFGPCWGPVWLSFTSRPAGAIKGAHWSEVHKRLSSLCLLMKTTLKWLKPIIIQEYCKWNLSMMPRYIRTVRLWMENNVSLFKTLWTWSKAVSMDGPLVGTNQDHFWTMFGLTSLPDQFELWSFIKDWVLILIINAIIVEAQP